MSHSRNLMLLLAVLAAMCITPLATATYIPEQGRWIERDPTGYVDGQNLYQFSRSRSITLIDPLGLKTTKTEDGNENIDKYTMEGENGEDDHKFCAPEQCHVVIALGLYSTHRDRPLEFRPDGNSHCAYGTLGCWADPFNYGLSGGPLPFVIPGLPHITAPIGTCPTNAPDPSHDDTPDDFPPYDLTNDPGDYNGGAGIATVDDAEVFEALLRNAWRAAVSHAEDLAEDCDCTCDEITVYFWCRDGTANKYDRETRKWRKRKEGIRYVLSAEEREPFCGRTKPIKCKSNAKEDCCD